MYGIWVSWFWGKKVAVELFGHLLFSFFLSENLTSFCIFYMKALGCTVNGLLKRA